MIPKPSACEGCPFYKHGDYFTPDIINPNSSVLFIAQNPGPNEEAGLKLVERHYFGYNKYHDVTQQVKPQPLIGPTGQLFDKKFLPLAGFDRSEVSLANAIRCRPGHSLGLRSDALPTLTSKMRYESSKADIVNALKHCRNTYLTVPGSTELIVTMGAYSLFQMTGIKDVTNWRGYAFDYDTLSVNTNRYNSLDNNLKLFSTMHIAALHRGENIKYYHATLQDFGKIKRMLSKQWPLSLPTWHDTPPATWPKYSAFDTEYDISRNDELIRWSLCDTDKDLYCVEAYNTPYDKIPISPGSTVLMQNALADIPHLIHIVNFENVIVEDLMLAHSVLFTGEPHSLNYIASIFGAFNRYKHLSVDQPQLYSALDAYEPMYIWTTGILPDFKSDQQSWRVYKKFRLPLINIIGKAQRSGQKLNSERLINVKNIYQQRIDEIQQEARKITGNSKFNIGGSKRLKEYIYGNI